MAHHTANAIKVNLSAAQVWKVIDDFASVEKFATTITSSPIIGDISKGLGAKRRCTFKDGSSLVEEIIDYKEGQGYTMALSDHTLPLKSMQAKMSVKAIDTNRCEIFMEADFVVKGGPLGWLMGALLMRPVMKGVFKKVMTGLAYHVETGELIGEKLPNNDQLNKLILN